QLTGRFTQTWSGFVIQGIIVINAADPNRIKMTTDGFFKVLLSFVVRFFNSTLHNALLIIIAINTNTSIYSRRHQSIFIIKGISTLFFYLSNGPRAQTGLDEGINIFNDIRLFLSNGCPGVSVHTTASFTLV